MNDQIERAMMAAILAFMEELRKVPVKQRLPAERQLLKELDQIYAQYRKELS